MNLSSFSYRVTLLLGLMLVVSLVDFYRNGARAVKFREYGFIIITGAVGGAVGFVNDLVTSSISPEYFILGKGLEESPDLRIQAGLFGLRVGFSAGVIGGAVCLYASQENPRFRRRHFPACFECSGCPWRERFSAALLCRWDFPNSILRGSLRS